MPAIRFHFSPPHIRQGIMSRNAKCCVTTRPLLPPPSPQKKHTHKKNKIKTCSCVDPKTQLCSCSISFYSLLSGNCGMTKWMYYFISCRTRSHLKTMTMVETKNTLSQFNWRLSESHLQTGFKSNGFCADKNRFWQWNPSLVLWTKLGMEQNNIVKVKPNHTS